MRSKVKHGYTQTGGSTVHDNKYFNDIKIYEANFKIADEVIDINNSVLAIKIDVEGSELNVLQGAKNILTQYKPIIFLSVHPEHLKILGQKTIEINNFLEKHEYKIYYTDESIVNNELKSEEYICISK